MKDDIDPMHPVDEMLIELAGENPLWLWPSPCSEPDCDCREVIILGTDRGRVLLQEQLGSLDTTLRKRRKHDEPLPQFRDLFQCRLSVETGIVYPIQTLMDPLDVKQHPQITTTALHFDGDSLDGIHALCELRKGRAIPELAPSLPDIERRVKSGEHLWYNEAYPSARRDLYVIDQVRYQALDQVCPDPTSRCTTVDISFLANSHPDDPYAGTVIVNPSGRAELIASSANQNKRLSRLWRLFRARHPNYIERCARRTAGVREVGAIFLTSP